MKKQLAAGLVIAGVLCAAGAAMSAGTGTTKKQPPEFRGGSRPPISMDRPPEPPDGKRPPMSGDRRPHRGIRSGDKRPPMPPRSGDIRPKTGK